MEVVVALGLLAVGLTCTVQVLSWMAAERRDSQHRQFALQAAANCLERLSAEPWDALTPARIEALKLGEAVEQSLPGGKLEVEVLTDLQQRDARRIVVEVGWKGRTGMREGPVRLVAWRWRQQAGT
jgi:Tfp pilus assembly protein PilV